MVLKWLFSKSKVQLPKNYKELIDSEALKIVEKLQRSGHEAYLVGGCVRDILLGKKPKDFDIATKATPQQVKSLIHRSFIIGRRFRIVVAKRNDHKSHQSTPNTSESLFPPPADRIHEKEFQITTYRREPVMVDGKLNENVFGTPKEDALRRDFTVNALFLDPHKNQIVDFVDGLKDIAAKKLRIIGNPDVRFKEDSIRILRALRFQMRTHLHFDEATLASLKKHIPELATAKRERIREEVLKALREGHTGEVFHSFQTLHIWPHVSPTLGKLLTHNKETQILCSKIFKSMGNNKWVHLSQSPLIYLTLYPLFQEEPVRHQTFAHIVEDLKISKAEQEDIFRIQGVLHRIAHDTLAENPARVLTRNIRFYLQLAQSFYCLKVLAEAEIAPFKNAWKEWRPHWETFLKAYLGASAQHQPGSHRASKRTGNEPNLTHDLGAKRNSRGRSRRRRPRGTSRSSTPAS